MHAYHLDSSNGAAVANRGLMECLHRLGFAVEVLCGTVVNALSVFDQHLQLLVDDPLSPVVDISDHGMIRIPDVRMANQRHLSTKFGGVPITCYGRKPRLNSPLPRVEALAFLSLLDDTLKRFRPDVLVTYGGDPLTLEILARCRLRGIRTVFTLHNFGYPSSTHFTNVDEILVPSDFSKRHHDRILDRECVAIPCLTDFARVRAEVSEPKYVTFVNPSFEKGVFPFVRIADELGRRRPDIPLLVVESRGSESTIVGCGIDLRDHGNVFLMEHTNDPRDFWSVTRICLMPSLRWESLGLVAVEAMINGIPVVASDRGTLPETLGRSGICLSLPEWLTPQSRKLPAPEEVAPWVNAVIRLWDDSAYYREQKERALNESRRWAREEIESRYINCFKKIAGRS